MLALLQVLHGTDKRNVQLTEQVQAILTYH